MKATIKQIKGLVKTLNQATNNPTDYIHSYEYDGSNIKYNVGCHYILHCPYNGGYALYQIVNENGNKVESLGIGFVTKQTLYESLRIYVKGLVKGVNTCQQSLKDVYWNTVGINQYL